VSQAAFIVSVVVFVVGSTLLFWRLYFVRRLLKEKEEHVVPPKVQEASHELANEVTKLRSAVRSISSSADVMDILVNAMRHRRGERDGRDSTRRS
jgi:hypothetical protein